MNRTDSQIFADVRLEDARLLLSGGQWSGAYYLAGYAVECALKACIAKLVAAEDFPDKRLADRAWTHDIEKLLEVANLKGARDAEAAKNKLFGDKWGVVKDWNEHSRYDHPTGHWPAQLWA